MHTVKAEDIPTVRFRDKGIPADNVSNYDSTAEGILLVAPLSVVEKAKILFVTEQSLAKITPGTEFVSSKRTIASTKTAEDDRLIYVGLAGDMDQTVMQTSGGYFIRFPLSDIPEMKKTAMGVKSMKLKTGDKVEHAYLLAGRAECTITWHDKPFILNKIKLARRGGTGTKPRA